MVHSLARGVKHANLRRVRAGFPHARTPAADAAGLGPAAQAARKGRQCPSAAPPEAEVRASFLTRQCQACSAKTYGVHSYGLQSHGQRRDREESRVVAPVPGDSFINRVGSTLSFATALGQIEVTVCTPRIVRVRLALDGQPAPPSYLAPRAWPPVEFAVRPGEPMAIDTGRLMLRVETNPLCLAFGDSSGTVMLCVPVEGGVRRESAGRSHPPSSPPPVERVPQGAATARRRLYAGFEPLGEQHFYGPGEGGKQFDRLGSA